VASIRSPQDPLVAAKPAARPSVDASDFAAIARDAGAATPAPAAALAPSAPASAGNVAALAGLLAQGDLAAARAALEQLGAHPAFVAPASPESAVKVQAADATQTPAATGTQKIVDVGSLTTTSDIDVHQVLLALA